MNTPHRFFAVTALILFTGMQTVSARQAATGFASWYNRGYHGLPTESGEAYDHEALTAAHGTFAFGTYVQITRVDDGRAVTVRINDRMVSGPDHVIDLSGAAARELGMLTSGVARVRVEPVAKRATEATPAPGPSSRPAVDISTTPMTTVAQNPPVSMPEATNDMAIADAGVGTFTLQLGVFTTREGAEEMVSQVDNAWIQSISTSTGTMYRVYYQRFDREDSARAAQSRLWADGKDSFLRRL